MPGSQWFVLVQPPFGQWANSNPLDGYSDFHFQSNMCGKNLAVWTYSGPVSSCNENISGVLARNLIDAAVSYGGSTTNIRDNIINSNKESILIISTKLLFSDEISYSLSHYFTIAFSMQTDWANSLVQSCAVDNNQAFYFIKQGPNKGQDRPEIENNHSEGSLIH